MEKEKSLATRSKSYSLASPSSFTAMARVLKEHIVKNQLSVAIQGKQYVMVEGWQFAGGLLGTMPRIAEVTNLSKDDEVKWMARAEIVEIKSGKVVATGFAICSKKESKKATFDEYAILSMAQTRAIGKAYRNVIGWVIKMAGYEATPSEEIIPPSKTPAAEATYNNALTLIGAAKNVKELERFRESLKKGRGAKLYNAEQRDQLTRLIEDKIAEIKKQNG